MLRKICGPLEVVRRTGGDFSEDDLFSRAAAQEGGDLALKVFLGIEEAFFCGELKRVTQGTHTSRNDRNFRHFAAAWHEMTNDRVANFVIRHHLFLVVLEHTTLFLQASDNTFNGFT